MSAARARVPSARPASAWLMVALASATLWITLQLAPWAMAAQGLAVAGSFARRHHPFRWQQRAAVLNLAIAAIVAASIAVALRGGPATIAFAHFAALTQGLQLLDARPRRTEFLLVTLSVFQVLLAANLTDSVFFTPLLVATLLATVWTLLVHTLRAEALEAGEDHALPRAISPGLLRTTLVASGLAVALALLLFLILPRLRSSVVSGPVMAPSLATAGFSERVELGALGRIRHDATVVLRVETLEGAAPDAESAYWRGLAFDHFDGRSWSITPPDKDPVAGSGESGVYLGSDPAEGLLVQRIVREPVAGSVLFAAGPVRRLQGTLARLRRDSSGGLYALHMDEKRVRYTVASERPAARDAGLGRDRAQPPRRLGDRYLQQPAIAVTPPGLAQRITAGARNDADRMRLLETHLRSSGRYTDDPPDYGAQQAGSPIRAFLDGALAGHCEYFASALVMLARDLGIPARLVSGFAGGRENRIGGFVELTRSQAHAWVEVHYEHAGWVRYDPTPPDLRAGADPPASFATRVRELSSAIELWWFQRVVGFDRSDQMRALRSAWRAWRDAREAGRAASERSRRTWTAWRLDPAARLPWREIAIGAVALAGLAWAAHRARTGRSGAALHPQYGRALRLLARRKLEREPSATARDFARRAATRLPPESAAAFAALTESYLGERFGDRTWRGAERDLEALRRGLRRGR